MEKMQIFLAICGGIAIVGGAGGVVVKLIMPALNLLKRISEIERRLASDYDTLLEIEAANKALCKAMLALVNHSIDGNGIEALKETREELHEMLINRRIYEKS